MCLFRSWQSCSEKQERSNCDVVEVGALAVKSDGFLARREVVGFGPFLGGEVEGFRAGTIRRSLLGGRFAGLASDPLALHFLFTILYQKKLPVKSL